tara:strand:- start:64 stop:360 length:297 start_codon:yes stop_codon:yes gene_type:complete
VQNKGQCATLPSLCAALAWARGKSRLEVHAEVVAWGKLWEKVQNAATDPASADLSDRNTVELWRKPLLYDTSPTRLFDVHNVVLYPLTRLYLLFFWSD